VLSPTAAMLVRPGFLVASMLLDAAQLSSLWARRGHAPPLDRDHRGRLRTPLLWRSYRQGVYSNGIGP
jgi:hypothetical protein